MGAEGKGEAVMGPPFAQFLEEKPGKRHVQLNKYAPT